MDTRFSDIQMIVWDFDGTIYRHRDDLFTAVRESEYQVIMAHTGWDREKTVAEFAKLHKVITPSGTEVVARLSNISVAAASLEGESHFERTKYLTRDEEVISLFKKLATFRHAMITNSVAANIKNALYALGISPSLFEIIVTPELTGVVKPDHKNFTYLIEQTRLSPGAYLMVGDRPAIDLKPAKEVGMKTCLVTWYKEFTEAEEAVSDVLVSTVYGVAQVLV